MAVSKTKPNEDIEALYALGQRNFGENYVQELVDKAASLPSDIHWHFIGHLQSNKVKYIAPFVYLIHGVDSEKLLAEINKQAIKQNKMIACLLQVHIATEETKFGFDATSLNEFIAKKFSSEEQAKLKSPKYFYEIEFDKPGGMIMPIIVELQFEDGTSETHHFPAQIWRKSNQTATRVFATEKPIKKIQLDPKLETADIDVTNNTWPKEAAKSKFDELDKSK